MIPAMYCRPIVDCADRALQALELVGGLVGIDGGERALHRGRQRVGIAARAQRERQVLRRRLRERPVEGRLVPPHDPLVDHVAGHADDGEPGRVLVAVRHAEALADRVLPRPEALGERPAHDRHLAPLLLVGRLEAAALQQRKPKRREEIRRRDARLDLRRIAALRERLPFDRDRRASCSRCGPAASWWPRRS